jgi:hypothetical protein
LQHYNFSTADQKTFEGIGVYILGIIYPRIPLGLFFFLSPLIIYGRHKEQASRLRTRFAARYSWYSQKTGKRKRTTFFFHLCIAFCLLFLPIFLNFYCSFFIFLATNFLLQQCLSFCPF